MQEVHRRGGLPDESDVAGEHRLLGGGWLARDPEPTRPVAFVHLTPRGEHVVLAVLGEDHAELARPAEGQPQHVAVLDPVAVVGEEADAERGHLGERRDALARPADGHRPRDGDVGAGAPATGEDVAHGRGRVDRRLGVRHGDDGRVTAEGRGARPGIDGLRRLASRFPQMGVEVDKPRRDDAA